jgi:hypothetical protein
MPRRQFLVAALALAGALTGSTRAHAQAPDGSTAKVSAEALFDEGRRLMGDGKPQDACPKFAESERLDPSPGTLLNLANCYEKIGRTATAWATYRQGASLASAAGRADLTATAERHADTLLPTLPRLTVTVESPVEGMTVNLDGVSVGRAEWGVAVPVDPGDHTLDASAPKFRPWSSKVTIVAQPTTTMLSVPALEAAPVEAAPPPPAAPAPAPAPVQPARAETEEGAPGRLQRTGGLVLGAVGVVGLAVGIGFTAAAKSTYNNSLADCRSNAPDECTQAGVTQRNSAVNDGNVATIALSVGAAAIAGGLVLWLTAPSLPASHATHASVGIVPTLGGGAVRATW